MIIFTYLLGIPFRGCLLAVSSLSDGCCVYVGYGRDVSLVWMFAASLLDHAAIYVFLLCLRSMFDVVMQVVDGS